MAAVDYNQNVKPTQAPESTAEVNAQAASRIDMAEDSVAFTHAPQPKEQPAEAPADSLAALLNRQVQQNGYDKAPATRAFDSQIANSSAQSARPVQSTATAEPDIEQQFKDFTERLAQSNTSDTATHQAAPQQMAQQEFATPNSNDFAENVAPLTATTHSQEQRQVSSNEFERMQKEMSSIRQLLEHQMSGLMWQDMAQKDPMRAVLVNRLTVVQ